MRLDRFRRNVYSQNGEDGVIEELLRRLDLDHVRDDRWCVEFGAWDGHHLSNTFNLVASRDWNAVYLEGDPVKYGDLERTAKAHPRISPILAMVGGDRGGGSALDDLLKGTALPERYDLLSVDIDSSDLDVWVRHVDYRPVIVVVEINSTVPPGVLQWHGERVTGNSFSSTVNVARDKGYSLVCHTGNLIFVADEVLGRVDLDPLDAAYPERLFLWDWVLGSERGWLRSRAASSVGRLPEPLGTAIRRSLRKA